jgi:hypothetical protein
MKNKKIFIVFTVLLVWAAVPEPNIFAQNYEAKVTYHLVNDNGVLLKGFYYRMTGFYVKFPGAPLTPTNSEGFTDDSGNVTLSLKSALTSIGSGIKWGTPGYYYSGYSVQLTNSANGKWQPWNPTVEVVVKPILNPIPMYAKADRLTIPSKKTPVGFDLEAGDWVAPYGKGTVSDFVFTITEKVPFVRASQPYDVTQTLSFSNKGDGIQSVLLPQNAGSALRLPRNAPESGYQPTLPQELSLVGNKRLNGANGEDQNYFYRVRTVLDEQGNVKSALYGKIAGPIDCGAQGYIQFTYFLNPTPNDRNMEFDPSKNLFQNLTDDQQVKAP